MSAAVIAIRPEPGLSATVQAGQKVGLEISGYPLFELEAVPWEAPDSAGFDALLVGSANVFRWGGAALEGFRALPVHAVGETTAAAARAAGFAVERVGKGGLQGLLDTHEGSSMHWLRLAGEEHVELIVPPECLITTRITYRVKPADFPAELIDSLKNGALVLLHSAAAARHFADGCDALELDRSRIALAALGLRILEPVGEGWRSARAAPRPDERALLALAKDMCETI